MKYFLNTIVLISLFSYVFGQQLKEVVKGHIDDAVKVTKEQLGIATEVKGQISYYSNEPGTNVTFVISGISNYTNDLYVKVQYNTKNEQILKDIGNTESGIVTSIPDWAQSFWFIWNKGTGQKWNFRVIDRASDDALVGEGTLDVDSFVGLGDKGESTVFISDTQSLIIKRTTPIKFRLAASNIQRSDEFNGKSDPYVKVYYRESENSKDRKFYTTSTIDNVENAKWNDLVEFTNYRKGAGQILHFKLRDADSVTKDDHLGEVLVPADSIHYDTKEEQTVFFENSGEHSSLTIIPY